MTRNKKILEAKVYVIVLQVIESKSADGIADGLTRMACEVGMPSHLLIDQDTGFIKLLSEAEVTLRDMQYFIQ